MVRGNYGPNLIFGSTWQQMFNLASKLILDKVLIILTSIHITISTFMVLRQNSIVTNCMCQKAGMPESIKSWGAIALEPEKSWA